MTIDNLISIISDVTKIDISEISKETAIYSDLAVDSLEMLKIITEVEAKLDVIFDNDKLAQITTVEELFNYITSR